MTIYITKNLKFNFKGDGERFRKILWRIIFALTVLAVVLAAVCIIGSHFDATRSDVSAEVRELLCGMGTDLPRAEDFLVPSEGSEKLKGEFVEDFPEIKRPGRYSAKVRFIDGEGKKTEVFEVFVSVISDTVPPEVEILGDVELTVGDEKPNYLHLARASDNCIGEVTLKYDDSGVNYEKKGQYSVKVTATDASGNKAVEKIKVVVVNKE